VNEENRGRIPRFSSRKKIFIRKEVFPRLNSSLSLQAFDPATDEEALVEFLSSQTWPYHGNPNPSAESVREGLASGRYTDEEQRTFWIVEGEGASAAKLGLVRVFDLGDPTPMFDVRLGEQSRGRGIGETAVRLLAEYVFTRFEDKPRLEGHTRADNYAMRKTFVKAGFVKEAYHRKAWPTGGTLYDSVGYAITREDWSAGKVTPIDWNDFPY